VHDEENKQVDSGNWVFAETSHVVGSKSNFAWWVVFVLRFKFHQNLLSGFQESQNLPYTIALTTGLYYLYFTKLQKVPLILVD